MTVTVLGLAAFVLAAAAIGTYVRGLRKDRGPEQPLGRVAALYGRFLLLYLIILIVSAFHGFYGNGGPSGSLCVNTGYPIGSNVANPGVFARHGAVISGTGGIRACALHPTAGQWTLFLLSRLPSLVLWAAIVVLVLQLVRSATTSGPFTPESAAIMYRLGWTVIGGSILFAALSALGVDLMASMLMTPAPHDAKGIVFDVLVTAPVRALFPVPALVGAALLTFARITRLGVAMNEELQGTV